MANNFKDSATMQLSTSELLTIDGGIKEPGAALAGVLCVAVGIGMCVTPVGPAVIVGGLALIADSIY